MHTFQFQAIGIVHSPYREKFGIPRQPGLVDILATVELLPPYNRPEAARGLEAFSHIWLSFVFHGVAREAWKSMVRPPRLGGNERVGVFASRSTHRPNPLGLSVVELLAIEADAQGVRLQVRGADLLDGTPILDIKPYLPYADSLPEARGGYAPDAPAARLRVVFAPQAEQELGKWQGSYPELRGVLEQLLSLDPRPAFHRDDAGRVYGLSVYEINVRFTVQEERVEVIGIDALKT
ncbi:MAG: tRNA (N6-threonylcarbamoyladenosine(37)-N6)-methyltransferase TrmO [Thiohalomonadaceae bacterium]